MGIEETNKSEEAFLLDLHEIIFSFVKIYFVVRVHCNSFRQKLLHSHSVELIGLVMLWFFFPLDCFLCSPSLYIKGHNLIWFFVVVIFIFFIHDVQLIII
jgi:hypothetical protein